MSNTLFDPNWTAKVVVPIKRVGNGWEFFYGGDVPAKDGAIADLVLNANDISDEKFKQRVTEEFMVHVLKEGTELCVALSDRSDSVKCKLGDWPEKELLSLPLGTTRIERIRLGPVKKKKTDKQAELDSVDTKGGLWLKVKGLERCELQGSTVIMPKGFERSTAISLNHAFTLLSEKYETHRLSHTGNVYQRIFYREPSGRWYPLDDLRQGVLADAERKLLTSAWEEVERKLGWRPMPTKPSKT
ncbi:MAG: hypothetical protein ACK4F8_08500 [Aquabacterium sp.]